jgi:DNA-binding NarL/FixJ family response regulator
MLNIIVAEDDKHICQSIGKNIKKVFPQTNILFASNGNQVLELLQSNTIAIIIMDIDMPLKGGLETTSKAMKINRQVKIICTSSYKTPEFLINMKILGVSGFIQKSCEATVYKDAIETVLNHDIYFAEPIILLLKEKGLYKPKSEGTKTIHQFHITETEFIVLEYLCRGLSNEEIAVAMKIKLKTVVNNLTRIYKKLIPDDTSIKHKREILKELDVVKTWFKSISNHQNR